MVSGEWWGGGGGDPPAMPGISGPGGERLLLEPGSGPAGCEVGDLGPYRAGGLEVREVRRAAHHRQPGALDAEGRDGALGGRRGRVLRPGDNERGRLDGRQERAQVHPAMASPQPAYPAGLVALSMPAIHATSSGDLARKAGVNQRGTAMPAMAVPRLRTNATRSRQACADGRGTSAEQMTEGGDPLGSVGGEPDADHAAERDPAERGRSIPRALSRPRTSVPSSAIVYGPGGAGGLRARRAVSPVLVADHPEVPGQHGKPGPPDPRVSANRVGEHEHGCVVWPVE